MPVARPDVVAGNTRDSYPYVNCHNILSYFTDVTNGSTQLKNLVSFSQFTLDLANNLLPNSCFAAPNLLHDAHDAPLNFADLWLRQNMAPLIFSSLFQKDGLLIIDFDE